MIKFLRYSHSTNKHRIGLYECGVCRRAFKKRIRKEPLPHSCGCETKARSHGHDRKGQRTPELRAWHKIRERCYNKNCKDYPNYGGRGIRVSPEWLLSFDSFLSDMGLRPVGNFTIERLDVNGDYTKDNCVWIPKAAQSRNRRMTRFVEFNGETRTITEWLLHLGISKTNFYRRLKRGESAFSQLQKAFRRGA
jgi:hypothetical protein